MSWLLSIALLVTATALLPSTGAFFYKKPTHPKCSVHQQVKFHDETIHAREIEVVAEQMVVPVYHLKTVYETTVVPLTSYVFHTVTAQALQVQVTETHVVTTVVQVPLTRVRTLTTSAIHTVVEVFTETATNYHSTFDTVALQDTYLVEVIQVDTVLADVTETVIESIYTTVLVTEFEYRTSHVVAETVASTVFLPHHLTSTHTLTKMVTHTYCPLPLEDH